MTREKFYFFLNFVLYEIKLFKLEKYLFLQRSNFANPYDRKEVDTKKTNFSNNSALKESFFATTRALVCAV